MRSREKTKKSPPSGDLHPSAAFEWKGSIKAVKSDSTNTQAIVREFVSVKEAKAITGISDWTWREWVDNGKCSSVKIGGRLLIPVSEIQRMLSEGFRRALKKNAEEGR